MKRTGAALAATSAGVVAVLGATAGIGHATDGTSSSHVNRPVAFGLTAAQKLVAFPVADPGDLRRVGEISGLKGDSRIVGIDFRVQNGKLYGVGDEGGIYVLNRSDASANKVSQLTVALEGSQFGVDFNPAADRLRVVSNTGQNLRHDVNEGGATTVDTPLTYPPATTTAEGIAAAAYTNNDLDATTSVTLFDIDVNLDQVAIQAPANSGQLSATGLLGVDADRAGFDIYSTVSEGKTVRNAPYATLRVDRTWRFYKVSPLTGDAELVRGYAGGTRVTDIAVRLDRS